MDDRAHATLALRRLGRRFGVLAVLLGLLVAAGGIVVVGTTWLMGRFTGAGPCVPVSAALPISAAGPSATTDEQRRNAAVIVETGRRLGVPERGHWIALATALQESGLRNIDYGDRDSLGLFQQRPSQGWGTPAQILDPGYAATRFYERLLTVPDWPRMDLTQAAQAVQRSAFPLAYARWEQTAADLLAEVAGPGAAAAPVCSPLQNVPANAIGGSGCTEDDPTSNGCVTPTTRYAITQAAAALGGLREGPLIRSARCHAQRPANPTSDHPLGKGCDLFPGTAGRFATGPETTAGWRTAGWFQTNAEALGVSYIIWQGRIWTPGTPDEGGWGRRYTGGGVYDPTDAVGGHFDHLHVSFVR